MAEKVTIMVIKVDLQCHRCYKKIKKVLCKYPQIRDQIYSEKNNTVTITVVCCSPEKIKQKICRKGGESIKGIEIKEPPKPKKPEEKKADEKKPEKPKEPPTPTQRPTKPIEAEKDLQDKDIASKSEKPATKPISVDLPKPQPVMVSVGYPPAPPGYPIGMGSRECYEDYPGGGPCFHGHGRPPAPCYEGYGRPVYDSWGGGGYKGYNGSRRDYFCEENPSTCTIM